MKIRLVFSDWQGKDFKSVYNTEEGIYLSGGDFHSGSTFDAVIDLDREQNAELKLALKKGFIPFFYVCLP